MLWRGTPAAGLIPRCAIRPITCDARRAKRRALVVVALSMAVGVVVDGCHPIGKLLGGTLSAAVSFYMVSLRGSVRINSQRCSGLSCHGATTTIVPLPDATAVKALPERVSMIW